MTVLFGATLHFGTIRRSIVPCNSTGPDKQIILWRVRCRNSNIDCLLSKTSGRSERRCICQVSEVHDLQWPEWISNSGNTSEGVFNSGMLRPCSSGLSRARNWQLPGLRFRSGLPEPNGVHKTRTGLHDLACICSSMRNSGEWGTVGRWKVTSNTGTWRARRRRHLRSGGKSDCCASRLGSIACTLTCRAEPLDAFYRRCWIAIGSASLPCTQGTHERCPASADQRLHCHGWATSGGYAA